MGLGNGTGVGDRPHGPAQDKWHDHRRLVGPGIGAGRLGHGAVPQQRRVDVDVAQNHAVAVHKIGPKQQAAHLNGVFGPLLRGDGAHVGFV